MMCFNFGQSGRVLQGSRLNPQNPLGEPDLLNQPLARAIPEQAVEGNGAGNEKLTQHENYVTVERVPFPAGRSVGKPVNERWLVHIGTIIGPAGASSDGIPNLSTPGCDGSQINVRYPYITGEGRSDRVLTTLFEF